jgi:TonB family protein
LTDSSWLTAYPSIWIQVSEYATNRELMRYRRSTQMRFGIKSMRSVGCEMKFPIPLAFLLLSCCLSAAQAQNESPTQEKSTKQAVQLKAIKTPVAPYPEEARKNSIEGKVTLSIIVDEKGRVSEAKVVSGPKELQSAALESVRMWQYEPPASGPVAKVEISYGFPKACPGPVSDHGGVEWSWGLRDLNGKVVAVADDDDAPPPRYLEEERKSGIAGKLVLSISLYSDGRVKEIRVIRSLSPALDKRTIDTVRTMKFRRLEADSAEPEDLRLQFTFRATCNPRF